jgi:hypothetical protein
MINRVLDLQNFTVGKSPNRWRKRWSPSRRNAAARRHPLAREKNFRACRSGKRATAKARIAGLLDARPAAVPRRLDLQKPAAAHMTPALFVNENMRLEVALRLMQRAGQRLAIVLARDGAKSAS